MTYEYKPKGVCSMRITFDIDDGIVSNVQFTGGCNGNLQGISKLVEGRRAEDIVSAIEGIKCGFKNTSCPDQLAQAIKNATEHPAP